MGLTKLSMQFTYSELITVARLPIMKNFFPTNKWVRKMIRPSTLDVSNLRMTKEGIYSTTAPDQMELVAKLISYQLKLIGLTWDKIVVTDATANVGGSTIAIALYAAHVHAVEINQLNFQALKQNVAAYGPKVNNKVTLYKCDYTKLLLHLKQDVVMIDPPWGNNYRQITPPPTQLFLSGIPVVQIVNQLKNNAKMIVLKYPLNFNFTLFRKSLDSNLHASCYKMKYMYLLVITPIK